MFRSAIDFNMNVDRVAHEKGDRVVITLSEWSYLCEGRADQLLSLDVQTESCRFTFTLELVIAIGLTLELIRSRQGAARREAEASMAWDWDWSVSRRDGLIGFPSAASLRRSLSARHRGEQEQQKGES